MPPIDESESFTPYEQQLTTNPFAHELELRPLLGVDLPGWVGASIGGLKALGARAEGDDITVVYGGQDVTARTRSNLLAGGALIVDVTPVAKGQSIAAELASDPDTASRVVVVPVGDFDAAVTWADPDERGVREHHLLWTDPDGLMYDVSAVRRPEELVAVARDLAC